MIGGRVATRQTWGCSLKAAALWLVLFGLAVVGAFRGSRYCRPPACCGRAARERSPAPLCFRQVVAALLILTEAQRRGAPARNTPTKPPNQSTLPQGRSLSTLPRSPRASLCAPLSAPAARLLGALPPAASRGSCVSQYYRLRFGSPLPPSAGANNIVSLAASRVPRMQAQQEAPFVCALSRPHLARKRAPAHHPNIIK